ncbi:PH, RCC1 and FYVE domains-containing protein 1-like [Nicotiana tomentosiformis]|uniref:PH, RCC1 and FYVE domains-containing protein 1-like n=1 Tax=Nicotiana tomentosiformis TaxID=4098 RepID=UPI00051CAA92|nr:PH, RCC1 and FYVE domains-containing protein 1-like [Nicotiana tomentosiformis]
MADFQRSSLADRDIDQAIAALKKGANLLKYGRRGKPKFCPFRLSNDESALVWYHGKEEKQLELCHVSRIIPGQRTAIFQRYPRPEKEYQSFSLICNDRSLDLICKDKDEAEVWIAGLKAIITRGRSRKGRNDARSEPVFPDSPHGERVTTSTSSIEQGDNQRTESLPQSRLGKAYADIISYTAAAKSPTLAETVAFNLSSLSSGTVDNSNARSSTADTFRVSLSSAISSSSQGSCLEDFDNLGDVFIWGEGTGNGLLGGGKHRIGRSSGTRINAYTPKALESTVVLDVQSIACGTKHAMLVTKQGEVFSWGEEAGGRLGHGAETDVSHPKLINNLRAMNVEVIACGEYHSCAVTSSGDLYTWGDGAKSSGLLGHRSEASHWIPKRVCGLMEGLRVAHVSCGPWHTALITSASRLFTFGDGTFGALGHGDRSVYITPREVESFKGLRTLKVACGVWHTAAIVELMSGLDSGPSDGPSGTLFTWGDGDKGRLGHGGDEPRLAPECIAALVGINFSQVACGYTMTVALTTGGRVYTMGSTVYGQLGFPLANGKLPIRVEGNIADSTVEEISCGSHHVAVLTSKTEVYTWGKGENGQLGHGDCENKYTPTLVDILRDKQVKRIVCGSNFTAAICVHNWALSADNSVCFGCRIPFNFRRKRHNCYNCGFVFCKACSSKKSLKASLAPSTNKPYRVCDDCFDKLQKTIESESMSRVPKVKTGIYKAYEQTDKESGLPLFVGQTSRLSSSDSFNRIQGRISRVDQNENPAFSFQSENAQRESFSLPKSPISPFRVSKSLLSASLPSARVVSQSTSPLPGKTSPSWPAIPTPYRPVRTAEVVVDNLKPINESLSQEVKQLKAQLEDLARKSQLLEVELERKTKQLKDVTAKAAIEEEKRKAAKQVIKSLTAQLKEITERLPEEQISTGNLDFNAEQTSCDRSRPSNGSCISTAAITECSGSSNTPVSAKGIKSRKQKAERMIQVEPGIYLYLFSLPDGGNELKRVRFSRKIFTEEEAEKWWNENGQKICEKYNITPNV